MDVLQLLFLGGATLLAAFVMSLAGFGYGLVLHYFADWIEGQRLFAVPGNHDTNLASRYL